MFTVYGVSGRVFRGSIEQLRQVGGVKALTRTKAIGAVAHDGHDPQSAFPSGAKDVPASAPSDEVHRSALAAYTQTQQTDSRRTPPSQVKDLMSSAVLTVPDTATVQQAWQTLAEMGFGQAPVINEQGMLVGLLSLAELLQSERLPTPQGDTLAWRTLMAQSVSDTMRTPVPSAAPDTDIRRVASILLDTGLAGLAVVDENDLVIGFISRSDILRAIVTEPPLDLWG